MRLEVAMSSVEQPEQLRLKSIQMPSENQELAKPNRRFDGDHRCDPIVIHLYAYTQNPS